MVKYTRLTLLIGVLFFLSACATSMTPTQVNRTLPTLTKSQFISQSEADDAVDSNRCKILVEGRNYTAPLGLTTKGDLRNGAKGIDEWVELDGGNAYILTGYKWVRIDKSGATQLTLEFDTMLCE